MKIIIIGDTGYIGKNVKSLFNKEEILGFNTKNLDLNKANFNKKFTNSVQGSIILYAAGIKRTKEISYEAYYKNINQFSNFLSITDLYRPKKILLCSSVEVYGEAKEIINENTSINPLNLYAESKLIQEKLLQYYAMKNNFKSIILRLTGIYGKGNDDGIIKKIIDSQNKKNTFKLFGTGSEYRDYIYIKDLAKIIYLLMKKNTNQELLNIATGDSSTIKALIRAISKNYQKNFFIKNIKDTSKIKKFNLIFDNSRLKNTLKNFQFQNIKNFNFKKEYET